MEFDADCAGLLGMLRKAWSRSVSASLMTRLTQKPFYESQYNVPHLSYPLTPDEINSEELHKFTDDLPPHLQHFRYVEKPTTQHSHQQGFYMDRLPFFITSSCDSALLELSRSGLPNCPKPLVSASTSSSTKVLCHFYFLLSNFADINTSKFSSSFVREPQGFPPRMGFPAVVALRKRYDPNDSTKFIWATDSVSTALPGNELLSQLGHVLEKKLTMPREKYEELYLNPDPSAYLEYQKNQVGESYHVSQFGRLIYRSQLDCVHVGIKGSNKVFDLKTRATAQIRYGMVQKGIDLIKLTQSQGTNIGSFEKEMYDMTRNAFLKYYFQACLGEMAGILVAFHNTQEMFGLHYLSKDRMAEYICGSPEFLQKVFLCSLGIQERVLEYILNDTAGLGDDLLTVYCTNPKHPYQMDIFVESLSHRRSDKNLLVPYISLLSKYGSEELSTIKRDELVSTEDRRRLGLVVNNTDHGDLISSALEGALRKYKLVVSVPSEFDGSVEFDVYREFSRAGSLVQEYSTSLRVAEYLPMAAA